MSKIKLMPEYNTLCLWWENNLDKDKIGDLTYSQAKKLGISDILIKDLEKWHDVFFNWLDWNDPGNDKEIDKKEVQWFYKKGISLWLRLISELNGKCEVIYYDLETNQIFENKEEYYNWRK